MLKSQKKTDLEEISFKLEEEKKEESELCLSDEEESEETEDILEFDVKKQEWFNYPKEEDLTLFERASRS